MVIVPLPPAAGICAALFAAATLHFGSDGPTTFVLAELPHPATAEIVQRMATRVTRLEGRDLRPTPHMFDDYGFHKHHRPIRRRTLTDAKRRPSGVSVLGAW